MGIGFLVTRWVNVEWRWRWIGVGVGEDMRAGLGVGFFGLEIRTGVLGVVMGDSRFAERG